MSDDVFYIRTGDKIGKPFRFGFFSRLAFLSFVIYTSYITYEYFRVDAMKAEIAKLRNFTQAKYNLIEKYDEAIGQINSANIDYVNFMRMIENVQQTEDKDAKSR
jgi:hypothetical protein